MTARSAIGDEIGPSVDGEQSLIAELRSRIRGIRRDPLRDGFFVAAALWCVAIAIGLVPAGVDSTEYHEHRLPNPYDVTTYGTVGGFWYPPPIAQLLYPFTFLPLGVFSAAFTGLGFAALYAVLGRWAWLGIFFPPVWWDLSAGNINTLLGACALFSARSPLLGLVATFTKPTAGVILLWHVVKRDLSAVTKVFWVGAAVAAASFVVSPELWFLWARTIVANEGYLGPGFFTIPVPLLPRLAIAVVLVIWGALTDRRWTLPLAAWLALPVLWWTTIAALIAMVGTRRVKAA